MNCSCRRFSHSAQAIGRNIHGRKMRPHENQVQMLSVRSEVAVSGSDSALSRFEAHPNYVLLLLRTIRRRFLVPVLAPMPAPSRQWHRVVRHAVNDSGSWNRNRVRARTIRDPPSTSIVGKSADWYNDRDVPIRFSQIYDAQTRRSISPTQVDASLQNTRGRVRPEGGMEA